MKQFFMLVKFQHVMLRDNNAKAEFEIKDLSQLKLLVHDLVFLQYFLYLLN